MTGTERSIFPTLSLDRNVVQWEKHLWEKTPVELRDGVYFKRDDYFAPLGYGGPNGSKMRQLVWLINRAREGKSRLVSGASVKSPQLSMSTIVAKHYGLPAQLVIGATNPRAAANHPNVQIASRFGAHFDIINVAYNPQLQRRVHQLAGEDAVVVEYGITLDHRSNSGADIAAFHELGANQVGNLPEGVDTLIVPAGSCNTLVSVLYGIAQYQPRIKNLITLGIGPDKLDWVHQRLAMIEKATDIPVVSLFRKTWPQYTQLAEKYAAEYGPYSWYHYNLQEAKFCDYQQEMKSSYGGIDFHPTYEGKMIRFLQQENMLAADESTCFWIVGSAPQQSVIAPFADLPVQEEVACL